MAQPLLRVIDDETIVLSLRTFFSQQGYGVFLDTVVKFPCLEHKGSLV